MFEERVVLGKGVLLEAFLFPDRSYRLTCRNSRQILVEYNSDGKRHTKALRGRASAYAFKSVEKLRYDFEGDAKDAQRQG